MTGTKRRLGASTLAATLVLALTPASVGAREAQTYRVVVDGFTGQVESTDFDGVVHPGDSVEICVVRANLMDYDYGIRVAETEVLKNEYPIVGIDGTPTESLLSLESFAGPPPKHLRQGTSVEEAIERLAAMTHAYLGAVQGIQPILLRVRQIRDGSHRVAWQDFDSAKACAVGYTEWPREYRVLDDLLAEEEEYGRAVMGISPDIEALLAELRLLKLEVGQDRAAGRIPDDKVYTNKIAVIDATIAAGEDLKTRIAATWIDIAAARATAGRWAQILTAFPAPILRQVHQIRRGSRGYRVEVTRQPITELARSTAHEPPKAGQDAAASVIGSFAYESHAYHHFNVSLGVAAIHQDDEREYGVVTGFDETAGVTRTVEETDATGWAIEPVALLGVYFRGVDNYDPQRKPAWMLNIGVEISTSPDNYLLGVAVDFRQGLVLGIGASYYEKVSLTGGWEVGDSVPSLGGTPIITTPPTVKDDAVGLYAVVAFRPSIFKAFWKEAKNP